MKKWFKKEKLPVAELEKRDCLNCGFEFQGYYCPNCGQSVDEFDRPFGFVFYDFMGNFFAFDSRFWKTFLNLIIRPGFLTTEFFKGKRETYAPPFRVFIFLSFVLFLLLEIVTTKGLNKALDYSFEKKDMVVDSTVVAELESAGLDMNLEGKEDSTKQVGLSIDWAKIMDGKNLNASLLKLADKFEEKLRRTEDEKSRRTLIKLIQVCRSPEQMVTRVLKYLSWAFFVLLPLFALFLKLFYIRRNVNYIRHLVFSVHFHSFLFLVFTIIVAVNLAFKGNWTYYTFWLILLIPVYLLWAMKHFYKQGIVKTFLKGTIISFIYNLAIILAFASVLVNAVANL